jgi:sugar lactone lactonase YvrE
MRVRLSIGAAAAAALTVAALAHASPLVAIYTIAGPSQLKGPAGIAAADDGTLVVADTINQRVRRIAPSGRIATIAGTGDNGFSGDGGPATRARFNDPTAVALGSDGSIYVADTGNDRVRVIRPNGTIATFAGSGEQGFAGDGGPATAAQLNAPAGLVVDPFGNVYISDTGNNRVRMVHDGTITTVAAAPLEEPMGLAFARDQALLIADSGNGVVRKLSGNGSMTTVATGLDAPVDVASSAEGGFYVAEQGANRVRRVDGNGTITRVAGTGAPRFGGDGRAATGSYVNSPHAIEIANSGRELLVADTDNDRIRYVSSSDHALRLAIAAPKASVTARLVRTKVGKRRVPVVRDVAVELRLSEAAKLRLTIRKKRGRRVATIRTIGGPDVVAVRLPLRLRAGKHRLTKGHYVLGVTATNSIASAATSLELVVR